MSQGFEKEHGPDDTASGEKEAPNAEPVVASGEKDVAQPLIIFKGGVQLSIDPDAYYRDPDLRRSIDDFFDLIGPADLSDLDDE